MTETADERLERIRRQTEANLTRRDWENPSPEAAPQSRVPLGLTLANPERNLRLRAEAEAFTAECELERMRMRREEERRKHALQREYAREHAHEAEVLDQRIRAAIDVQHEFTVEIVAGAIGETTKAERARTDKLVAELRVEVERLRARIEGGAEVVELPKREKKQ